MSENSSVGVAEQPNGLSALENHLANTKRSRSPIALTTSAKRALTGSPGLTPPDTSNKRAKVSPSGDTTPSPADAEIRTLKTELLAAKNATLKAKLDNEQSKSKVVEKDRALVALREEYQHFKAEATATLEKYQREGRGVSEGTDSQLRLQLEQAQARNAALEARIQELEVKIKADRAQWENERQQMAEMVELLEQIEQAAKGGREPEAESREKLGQLAVASTNAVRKTPEVGRTERAPTQGLSNADLGIGIEAEEEDDDPNLNAVIPVDEEALRMVEEQKRREAELRVEVPEDALAELKKEPGLVEDFPVSLSNHRPVLTNPNPVERREAMMLHRNMHPMQNPGPSVMDDIRRMSVPPGANMFARTPLGMSPMRPPGPSMMGPPMGTPMMGPRPPFPMQQKMESPMPMEPPFPVQRPFSQTPFPQTPIDPMAAYFAMMAAAFPGMARPMVIPPGVSSRIDKMDIVRNTHTAGQGPTPSMDGGPQMMNGQLPVPARPASMQPVDPLAANVKTEPGTEPVEPPAAPPVTETLPPSVPEGTPVVDDKEVTIYKIKAALYVKESRARAERKACEQGTIAVKAILTKMGSGRLVMYDDWTDDKVMNVSLTGHVTTKTEFRDVFVTVQVDGETIVYIINLPTPQAAEELYAAIQNISVTALPFASSHTKERSVSREVVDYSKSAVQSSNRGAGGSTSELSTAAVAAEILANSHQPTTAYAHANMDRPRMDNHHQDRDRDLRSTLQGGSSSSSGHRQPHHGEPSHYQNRNERPMMQQHHNMERAGGGGGGGGRDEWARNGRDGRDGGRDLRDVRDAPRWNNNTSNGGHGGNGYDRHHREHEAYRHHERRYYDVDPRRR